MVVQVAAELLPASASCCVLSHNSWVMYRSMAQLSSINDFAKLILEEWSAEVEFNSRIVGLSKLVLNYVRDAR